MAKKGFDFAGYVSRTNVRCTDGTVIRPGCFQDMDGKTVPLVYQHNHDSIGQVLGHCELEERPEGTYAYAYCNDTPAGQTAKEAVQHGDINAFSIWANNLRRNAGDIYHGVIREVSLVLSGADKTALIDTVVAHGEISDDEAEIQFLGGYADMETYDEYLEHEEKMANTKDNGKTIQDVIDSMDDDQQAVLNYLVGKALEDGKSDADDDEDDVEHADYDEDDDEEYYDEDDVEHDDEDDDDDSEETVQDVIDTLTPKQKKVVNFLVGTALNEGAGGDDEDDQNDEDDSDEEDDDVKHNAFEDYGEYVVPAQAANEYLSHDDLVSLENDATSFGGSLRDTFRAYVDEGYIQHDDSAATYGIDNIDYLFPDARTIDNQPTFIKRNTDWVDGVLAATHRTPFARVKSIFADITEDEARAKGYIKGNLKKEEVFTLLKRVTEPQTIYKKQKLDKDDIDDITGFDVIAWIKTEMQLMLREEIARAILIGDGRATSDNDHIKEDRIRPVYNDADLYTIKYAVEVPENATDDQKAKALLKAALKARKLYKGTGTPTFYTKEDELTNALLLENGIGERMYKSEAEVATAMRFSSIVPVEVMEGLQIEVADADGNTKTKYDVAGVAVNLADYNIGTNGGAKTDFFDDFDLNYNQQICLYETRLSGALVKPFAAICFYYKTAAAA